MRKMFKGITIPVIFAIIAVILSGCTPGKAQTKGNDYKGSFETEEFEAFDNGEDEIPSYNKKVSSTEKSPARKDYDNNIAKIKRDYDREDSYSDYENEIGRGKSSNDSYGISENFYQKGMASWYGREFHGKVTASGETFDMYDMTAAHKTLPFGSIVEVKNLENGKTVRLKINDRGPYRGNRIIDVSYGAAKKLDMVNAGEAAVGINVIKMGSNEAQVRSKYVEPVSEEEYPERRVKSSDYSDNYSSADYKLQAGAFYSRNNAESLKKRIESITDRPVRIVQDGDFYKVRVEGIRNKSEMNRIKDSLSSENISSFTVE
ncbi:MAG TPA: septal ring lytic transglycosylase RlpA family protein [Spirochaetota bacterium]|nr:septal ring lytic transglycosylase RlpA family protein [Spirochaetota bacterium]